MHRLRLPLDPLEIASLERATLDAVAPPAVAEIDGWLIPFDQSTIGRAKSAVPICYEHTHARDVAIIESLYAAQGLQAAYRLADVPALAPIQAALAHRGYQAQQPTLVQVGSVATLRALCHDTPARVSASPDAAWASVYMSKGFDAVDGAHRIQALSRSQHMVYAWVEEDGQAVAAGTASFSQGWCSIHGMRTIPVRRGRGLAAQILAGLADSASEHKLARVFLQVEEDNSAGLALYGRAGFETAWRYHYWRKP